MGAEMTKTTQPTQLTEADLDLTQGAGPGASEWKYVPVRRFFQIDPDLQDIAHAGETPPISVGYTLDGKKVR